MLYKVPGHQEKRYRLVRTLDADANTSNIRVSLWTFAFVNGRLPPQPSAIRFARCPPFQPPGYAPAMFANGCTPYPSAIVGGLFFSMYSKFEI
jgi:hypothetical protein